jgi:curved DNA-binding protein CbpA
MAGRNLWDQVDADLYEVLGVSRTADGEQLQAAWRTTAKRLHPDVGGSIDEFQSAEIAYEVLSNPIERSRYDRYQRHLRALNQQRAYARSSAPFGVPTPTGNPGNDYEVPRFMWSSPNFAYVPPPNRQSRPAPQASEDRAPRNPWMILLGILAAVALLVIVVMFAVVSFVLFVGALVLFAGKALKTGTAGPRRGP